MENNKKIRIITLTYYIVLYILWAVLECVIVPQLGASISSASLEIIKEVVLKILLWSVPAFFIIRKYGDHMFIDKSEILGTAKKVFSFIPMYVFILLFSAFQLIPALYRSGKIVLSPSFRTEYILTAVFAGITEEMVFRGMLLNTAMKEHDRRIAFFGNALMFLMIHFPIWLREGVFATYMTGFAFIQVMVLSLIFSWTFARSRCIVVPVILHAYWDILCFVFA